MLLLILLIFLIGIWYFTLLFGVLCSRPDLLSLHQSHLKILETFKSQSKWKISTHFSHFLLFVVWFSESSSLKTSPSFFQFFFLPCVVSHIRWKNAPEQGFTQLQGRALIFQAASCSLCFSCFSYFSLLFHSDPLAGKRKPFNSPPHSPFHLLTFVFEMKKRFFVLLNAAAAVCWGSVNVWTLQVTLVSLKKKKKLQGRAER